MSGTDKEPIGSVSVCGPASEGQSSILDESVQETVCENALDYARDVYKFSFNPPLASIQGGRDKAMAYFSSHMPRLPGTTREETKQNIRDFFQARFKDALKKTHEEAVPKALAAFEFATRAVAIGCAKQEYRRRLEEFMTNEYEGFEDSQCKRALEHASKVYISALKPLSHTMTGIVKERFGSVSLPRSARKANTQSVQETDCQNALDHAKDVYKSSFKPPRTMLIEAGNKTLDAYKVVAVGAGGPGSIRRQYKRILLDIIYKDVMDKTQEEAVSNALLAFEYAVVGFVGSVKEEYKRTLEEFMRNEYEGYERAECQKILARLREILASPLNIQYEEHML